MDSSTRPPRRRRRLAARLALAGAATGAAMLGLGSCTFLEELFLKNAEWHATYSDSTKNLIAARGFAAPTIDLTATGPSRTGVWAWPWKGNEDAADFDYMIFEASAEAPPAELPAGSPVFALELRNLAPAGYGGDFTRAGSLALGPGAPSAPGDNPWWVGHAAPADQIEYDAGHAGGYRIKNEQASGGDFLAFDLGRLLDSPSSTERSYRWRSRGKFAGSIDYGAWDGTTPPLESDLSNLVAVSQWGDLPMQPELLFTASSTRLYFGGSEASLELDDFRAVRVDIDSSLRMRLAIDESDPPLIPTHYEFSVYAKRPSGSTAAGESGAAEPFAARSAILEMNAVGESLKPRIQQSYAVGAEWTRLVLRGENFEFSRTETGAVLELAIRPYGELVPDSGRVLLAAPSLNVYYQGYPE